MFSTNFEQDFQHGWKQNTIVYFKIYLTRKSQFLLLLLAGNLLHLITLSESQPDDDSDDPRL